MLRRRPLLVPVLACAFQVAFLCVASPCQAAPGAPGAPDLRTQTILPPDALSFQTQQTSESSGLQSWLTEDLTVHGKRHAAFLAPPQKPFLKQYDDGHAAGDITLWKGIRIHMQFGEDTRHDPVTGASIAPFGEAYRLSNPLRHR
ncbi:hypothetical protein [Acetobacter persici]|uniref:hypothetical protein n=1 Tax=Acetobacter persici TaxID=1076596 RepID=UPI001BA618BD|nr:hypothetical protein [Acetobacter persici]MBS0962316.1 hypothetical protein [Acetobacter persici]